MSMIRAVLEQSESGCIVYAPDFPGAYARGATADQALAKLPLDVVSYCRWIGAPPPDAGDPVVVVQTASTALTVSDADSEVLFDTERRPLGHDDYVRGKTLALRSAADVQTLLDSIPDQDATDLPARPTFYGDVPRTAREMVAHLNGTTAYYTSRLGVDIEPAETILASRELAFAAMEVPGFLDDRVFTDSANEEWTLRKVLRRFVWHDRIHARAMYRMAVRLWGPGTIANTFQF